MASGKKRCFHIKHVFPLPYFGCFFSKYNISLTCLVNVMTKKQTSASIRDVQTQPTVEYANGLIDTSVGAQRQYETKNRSNDKETSRMQFARPQKYSGICGG